MEKKTRHEEMDKLGVQLHRKALSSSLARTWQGPQALPQITAVHNTSNKRLRRADAGWQDRLGGEERREMSTVGQSYYWGLIIIPIAPVLCGVSL